MSSGRKNWVETLRLRDEREFHQLSSSDQVDVVCDAFESRWNSGPVTVEEFLEELPLSSDLRSRLIEELIPLEFDFRNDRGEFLDFGDLVSRFPDHALFVARFLCQPEQQASLATPTKRCDNYWLLELVGRGSFGMVYRAYDAEVDRFVAVKVPTGASELDKGADFRRFEREAKNVGRLSHPGIVPIFKVGRDETGRPFLVSDFVEGETVTSFLERQGRVAPRTACSIVAQLAEAMDYAHCHHVIHRDLKPGNIMLEARKLGDSVFGAASDDTLRPRILDFGLARRQDADASKSLHGSIIGTPAYMSPEQAKGATVDLRSDVYSLGAILYELLFGQKCFSGETYSSVLLQVVDQDVSPPKASAGVPRDLVTICLKCLNKEPKDRYQTAAELADDLRNWLQNKEIMARRRSPLEKGVRWLVRNRGLAAILLITVAVVTMAAGVAWRSNKLRVTGRANRILNDSTSVESAAEVRADQSIRRHFERRLDQGALAGPQRLRAILIVQRVPEDEELLEGIAAMSPVELAWAIEQLRGLRYQPGEALRASVADWPSDGLGIRAASVLAGLDARNELIGADPKIFTALQRQGDIAAWCHLLRPIRSDLRRLCRALMESDEPLALRIAKDLFTDAEDWLWFVEQSRGEDGFVSLAKRIDVEHYVGRLRQLGALPIWVELPPKEREASLGRIQTQVRLLAALCVRSPEDGIQQSRSKITFGTDHRAGIYFASFAGYALPHELLEHLLELCDPRHTRDADLLYCLCIALPASLKGRPEIQACTKQYLLDIFCNHEDSGVHGAATFALKHLGLYEQAKSGLKNKETPTAARNWFYSKLGICMVVIPAGVYDVWANDDVQTLTIQRSFAVASTEVDETLYARLNGIAPENSGRTQKFDYVRRIDDLANPSPGSASVIDTCLLADEQLGIANHCFQYSESHEDVYLDCDTTISAHRVPTRAEWEAFSSSGSLVPYEAGVLGADPNQIFHRTKMGDGGQSPCPHDSAPNRLGTFSAFGGYVDVTITEFDPTDLGNWESPEDRSVIRKARPSVQALGGSDERTGEYGAVMVYVGDSTRRPDSVGFRFVMTLPRKGV